MSTGGIFNLITNDGKQDRMLMASELLSQRLAEIREARKGLENPNPTLADIERTHILFMNAHFKPFAAIAYEYNKVTANNPTLGSKVQFSIPQFGDFFSDMVVHVVLKNPTVSVTGWASGSENVPIYRWCEFPGERLFQKVSFDVNGNPLDEYYPDTYNFHRQFYVTESKRSGWNRCMGQEEAIETLYDYNSDNAVNSGLPQNVRAAFLRRDGHQTYKANHEDLELFIPLLFWFNTDPRLAIPSVAIPYGQRFINIDLANKEDLVRVAVNPAGDAATTAVPAITTPVVSTFDLYINNIFVNPDIHDIFIARIGFTLVRVHRRQVTNVNKSSDNVLLQQLKWPIETMFVGIRPTANYARNSTLNTTGSNTGLVEQNMDDWHKFCQVVRQASLATTTLAGTQAPYSTVKHQPHVTRLTVSAHGVPLYNNLPAKFFNSYVPLQYGGWNIATPTDPGAYMITFNLYPGTYQPSGHINVSRAREFYLQYDSPYVASDKTAELIVNAVAINFLLISDGSATLRYAT
jgi:hypothetical protein